MISAQCSSLSFYLESLWSGCIFSWLLIFCSRYLWAQVFSCYSRDRMKIAPQQQKKEWSPSFSQDWYCLVMVKSGLSNQCTNITWILCYPYHVQDVGERKWRGDGGTNQGEISGVMEAKCDLLFEDMVILLPCMVLAQPMSPGHEHGLQLLVTLDSREAEPKKKRRC